MRRTGPVILPLDQWITGDGSALRDAEALQRLIDGVIAKGVDIVIVPPVNWQAYPLVRGATIDRHFANKLLPSLALPQSDSAQLIMTFGDALDQYLAQVGDDDSDEIKLIGFALTQWKAFYSSKGQVVESDLQQVVYLSRDGGEVCAINADGHGFQGILIELGDDADPSFDYVLSAIGVQDDATYASSSSSSSSSRSRSGSQSAADGRLGDGMFGNVRVRFDPPPLGSLPVVSNIEGAAIGGDAASRAVDNHSGYGRGGRLRSEPRAIHAAPPRPEVQFYLKRSENLLSALLHTLFLGLALGAGVLSRYIIEEHTHFNAPRVATTIDISSMVGTFVLLALTYRAVVTRCGWQTHADLTNDVVSLLGERQHQHQRRRRRGGQPDQVGVRAPLLGGDGGGR